MNRLGMKKFIKTTDQPWWSISWQMSYAATSATDNPDVFRPLTAALARRLRRRRYIQFISSKYNRYVVLRKFVGNSSQRQT